MNKLEVNEVGVGFPHRARTWNYCCVAVRPAELLACVLREGREICSATFGEQPQLPEKGWVSGLLSGLCIPLVVVAGTNTKLQDSGGMKLAFNSL